MKILLFVLTTLLLGSIFFMLRAHTRKAESSFPTEQSVRPANKISLSVDGQVNSAELNPGETIHVIISGGKITDVQLQ